MNLIEALKKADGKPVARCFGNYQVSVKKDDYLVWRDNRRVELTEGMLLADDWYVVTPKSPIEEAIERELDDYSPTTQKVLGGRVNRIVNIALDEAKKAVEEGRCDTYGQLKAIDALKVKI